MSIAAVGLEGPIHAPLDVGGNRHVTFDGDALPSPRLDLADNLLALRDSPAGDRHLGAGARQGNGDPSADP